MVIVYFHGIQGWVHGEWGGCEINRMVILNIILVIKYPFTCSISNTHICISKPLVLIHSSYTNGKYFMSCWAFVWPQGIYKHKYVGLIYRMHQIYIPHNKAFILFNVIYQLMMISHIHSQNRDIPITVLAYLTLPALFDVVVRNIVDSWLKLNWIVNVMLT